LGRNPFKIGPEAGVRPLVETLVSLLSTSRHYLLNAARNLTAESLDEVPTGPLNSLGSLLVHVAAAETMFQNITFHGRQFGPDEEDLRQAFRFERNPLAGSEMDAYRDLLVRTHRRTVSLLAGVDDDWLAEPTTFRGKPSNRHYYWMHFMLDEARHTGQLILIRKRLLGAADASFDPYAV
jgi:uncharacterized damage-inducible protein DinB